MNTNAWTPASPLIDSPTLRSELPTTPFAVVHFWAVWNSVDRKMDDLIQSLRPRFQDRIAFYALETDPESAHDLCRECEIGNLPALVFFRDGERIETLIGLRRESELVETFNRWVA